MLRKCSSCNSLKTNDSFYRTYRRNRGYEYSYYCKKCQTEIAKKYNKNAKANKKKWREKNTQAIKDKRSENVKKLSDSYVAENIMRGLGLKYAEAKKSNVLMNFYRAKIKLKRLIKQKENEFGLND